MKLIRLDLQNFQGIKTLAIENPDGKDITIRGENGTGKTTVANAVSWLLFGKPTNGEKGYNPKTIGTDGTEVHQMHHIAVGQFLLDDGTTIELSKDFWENWQKIRGRNTETYKGNVTDYYIDGVPVKEKDYNARLSSIFEQEQALMLTLPEYFAQTMNWQKRREILLEVCGDYTDEEVIAAEPELEPLNDLLRKNGTDQRYTLQDFEKMAAEKKKKINEALKSIPTRIDEAQRTISADVEDKERVEAEIDALMAQIVERETELEQIRNGGEDLETKREITSLEAKLNELATEQQREYIKQRNLLMNDVLDITARYEAKQAEYRQVHGQIAETAMQKGRLEDERERLLADYKKIQSQRWTGSEICPTCGQQIPEAIILKSKADFNHERSEKLTAINERGKECSREIIEKLAAYISEQNDTLLTIEEDGKKLKQALEKAKEKAESLPLGESEEMNLIADKIGELKAKLEDSKNKPNEKENELKSKIFDLREAHKEKTELLAKLKANEVQRKRIDELKDEEKRLARDYEEAELHVYLAELFTRTKATMLDARVNEKFDSVRFNLFETQINGGQVDACTVMVQTTEGLKPFAKANTGAKIRAAVEIMDTLGNHYGIHLPIILDNFESVTNTIRETAAQKIKLSATAGVEKLEIKTE